jgi:amino acid transporter
MEEIQETIPEELPETIEFPETGATPQGGLTTGQIIGIVLIGIVVVVIIGLMLYGLATHPILTSILRDISIIALALVTLIIGLFLIILIFQLQSLIVLLRDEVRPILDSANETANTVRGTTTFVSDTVVTPMIHVVSLFAGVGQTWRTLRRTGHKRTRPRRTRPTPPPEV